MLILPTRLGEDPKYQTIELPYIELSKNPTIADVTYIYSEAHFTLRPTTASKILHMFNPNLFPIWDSFMRKNLFRTNGHNPSQYVSWMSLMQKELGLIIKDTESTFHLSSPEALGIIKNLDHPTCSLLRIMDKVNYNNSRKPLNGQIFNKNVTDQMTEKMNGGATMAFTILSGRIDTGLKLSDFVKNHLPQIDGFSMNKPGGFTYEEEKQLWQQGKMTASFLKQVATMLQYPTFQVSNYDLLNTLKSNRQKILELLRNKPELDSTIRIRSKGQKPTGSSGLLKSPLFDD